MQNQMKTGKKHHIELDAKIGCKVAQETSETILKDMEEKLFQKRDKKWKVQGFVQRTCVTRFGDVTISRRLYKKK